tara:strand:- start:265 stop:1134 length:870 start_codon:yes stop_codon:yes gene_type:complete
MIKKIKYILQAIIVYFFLILIKLTGLKFSRKIFSSLFKKVGPYFKSENIIDSNLNKFMGSYNEEKKKEIVNNMWSNYGSTFVEYLFLKNFRNNNDHIIIKGENIIKRIVEEKKPVIFISGHFANFELMSMELTKKNLKLATIYRPLNNFFINPIMEYFRRTYVCKNQIKKGITGVKETVEYIKKNYSIALMIDQRVSEGKRLPFFENMALTTTLPAQLALKYNLDIVPVYIARKKNNKFEMEVYEPIKIFSNKESETKKLDITLQLNKILEQMIVKDPSQWIWTHNRWK